MAAITRQIGDVLPMWRAYGFPQITWNTRRGFPSSRAEAPSSGEPCSNGETIQIADVLVDPDIHRAKVRDERLSHHARGSTITRR